MMKEKLIYWGKINDRRILTLIWMEDGVNFTSPQLVFF